MVVAVLCAASSAQAQTAGRNIVRNAPPPHVRTVSSAARNTDRLMQMIRDLNIFASNAKAATPSHPGPRPARVTTGHDVRR